jgi:hypothetical protein
MRLSVGSGRTTAISQLAFVRAVLRARYVVLSCVAVALALPNVGEGHGDWSLFSTGARALFAGRGLSVYAHNIDLVIGPVGLAVTRTLMLVGGYDAFIVVGSATGLGLIYALERLANATTERQAVTLLAGTMFLVAWIDMVAYGHVDDTLACCFVVGALWGVASQRNELAGVSLGLALATKPWAVTHVTGRVRCRRGSDRRPRCRMNRRRAFGAPTRRDRGRRTPEVRQAPPDQGFHA